MTITPHYRTDHNVFHNAYAMFAYAAVHTPHVFPTFDLYDKEFGALDWTKEPELSFSALMEMRAIQLRQKYDKIVLYFSGGTDSTTMYLTFKRLNIHIDEIVVLATERLELGQHKDNVKWLVENHDDPTTLITTGEYTTVPGEYHSYTDDFLTNSNVIVGGSYYGGARGYRKHHIDDAKYANCTSGHIFGVEKPLIQCIDGKWYAYHLDKIYAPFLCGTLEWFYVSPDLPYLHVKQCHMLKNNLRRVFGSEKNCDSAVLSRKNNATYTLVAEWAGRVNDVVPENSFTQKIFYDVEPINTLSLINGGRNYISREEQFNKYVVGFKSMQADTTITGYMKRHQLLSDNQSIDQYYGIYGKSYWLGD